MTRIFGLLVGMIAACGSAGSAIAPSGDGASVEDADVPDATVALPDDAGGDAEHMPDAIPIDAPCGPDTCATGCCDAKGHCVPYDASSTCIGVGHQCEVCGGTYSQCVPQVGCIAPNVTDCDDSNCAGCCVRNGIVTLCVQGTANGACGVAGQICGECPEGLSCTPSGLCRQQFCGPQQCGGCCVGNECRSGAQQSACGAGGAKCADCPSQGLTCQAVNGGGACKPPLCNPQTCVTGCCHGDLCLAGTQDIACGSGGGACSDCTANSTRCSGGACQ